MWFLWRFVIFDLFSLMGFCLEVLIMVFMDAFLVFFGFLFRLYMIELQIEAEDLHL